MTADNDIPVTLSSTLYYLCVWESNVIRERGERKAEERRRGGGGDEERGREERRRKRRV